MTLLIFWYFSKLDSIHMFNCSDSNVPIKCGINTGVRDIRESIDKLHLYSGYVDHDNEASFRGNVTIHSGKQDFS